MYAYYTCVGTYLYAVCVYVCVCRREYLLVNIYYVDVDIMSDENTHVKRRLQNTIMNGAARHRPKYHKRHTRKKRTSARYTRHF